MVGWAAVEFDMLRSTPGKVLCLHGWQGWWLLPSHRPCPASACASCSLPPGTGGTRARADQTHTRTQCPVVLRNCWQNFQESMVAAIPCAAPGAWERSGAWSCQCACFDLGARQRQVSAWCPRAGTVKCLCSTAPHQPAHPCPHPTLQHPGTMFRDSNQMVFREQKHLKCVCHGLCSTQERVNLCWEIRSWCRSCRTLNSKVVTAAAPAEYSPAVQAVRSKRELHVQF